MTYIIPTPTASMTIQGRMLRIFGGVDGGGVVVGFPGGGCGMRSSIFLCFATMF
jgi:hypothetical protein